MNKKRYLFLDFIRLFAVMLMIQGHVFRVMLSSSIKQENWWKVHETIHGITAPLFLFGAGFIMVVISRRDWQRYLGSNILLRRFKRFLSIILLGYWLHLPYFSLKKILCCMNQKDMLNFFSMDILQCIGMGLILLQLLIIIFRKPTPVMFASFILGTVFMLEPNFLKNTADSLPLFFSTWISSKYNRLFPLFPWAGYLILGGFMGFLFPLKEEEKKKGILYFLIFLALFFIGGVLYSKPSLWNSFTRFSMVLFLTTLSWLAEEKGIMNYLKSFMFLGQESLFAYVFHLVIVFGSVLGPGLSSLYKNSLSLLSTTLLCIAVFTITALFSYLWHLLKTNYPFTFKIIQWSGISAFIILFITRAY